MSDELEPERCYRHANRETYIHCQRCDRPVCLDCQTQGAVGVLCPTCVSPEATSRRRRVRFRLKGTTTPVVTYWLIGLTLGIYVLQWIPGLDVTGWLLYAPIYSYGEYSGVAPYEPWRLVTSTFVHSTGFVLHILLNMYTLWIFGQLLETMLGRIRFLSLYLLSGLGGSIAVMYLGDLQTGVVGASGAIFGLLGAFLVIQRKLGGDSTQLLILVGINLVIGFLPGLNISWQAHVGGLVVGLVLGAVFSQTRRPSQQRIQALLVAALGFALLCAGFAHAPFFVAG